ncbi:MAG TPA: hypothetical protein VNF74_04325 [Terriglobales bacterium]|nr:hypothetical protein [Terriglobales bacterium]
MRQPARQQQPASRPARSQPERQSAERHVQIQRSEQQRRVQEGEQRSAWQQLRANARSEDRSWQERGGYRGYRVPDRYYGDHYGENHMFVVYSLPFMQIGGYPSFQYSGYWFSMVDPVPEYWQHNWYQDDDVYVVYADSGYYLYNSRYPGHRGIAITVSF